MGKEGIGSITFEEALKSSRNQAIVDSQHLAAVELMTTIAGREGKKAEKPNLRAYYFELYQQCYKIVCGADIDSVLNCR